MEYAGTHLDSLCLLKKEQGALSTKAQVQSRLFINAFTTQIVSFASVVFSAMSLRNCWNVTLVRASPFGSSSSQK